MGDAVVPLKQFDSLHHKMIGFTPSLKEVQFRFPLVSLLGC